MGLDELIAGDTVLSRYEIIGNLGRGGTAKVYRAKDTLREDEVALKIINADLEVARREVAALHKLAKSENPNVVKIYDADIHEDRLIISEELVEGETLFDFIYYYHHVKPKITGNKLSERYKLEMMYQIADGLKGMHFVDIVHRDLNPWNIIVPSAFQINVYDAQLKIIDLGKTASLDELRNSLGSGFFSSPEQYESELYPDMEVDHRTDIFSAGILFYYIETGDFPFHDFFTPGDLHPIIEAEKRAKCRVRASKCEIKKAKLKLKDIIVKCLAPKPWNRYGSAFLLASDIREKRKKLRHKDYPDLI